MRPALEEPGHRPLWSTLRAVEDNPIARRAFWFLDERDLPPKLRAAVDAFYEKHQDRL